METTIGNKKYTLMGLRLQPTSDFQYDGYNLTIDFDIKEFDADGFELKTYSTGMYVTPASAKAFTDLIKQHFFDAVVQRLVDENI